MKTKRNEKKEIFSIDITSPGVYQFLNKKKETIYIGKAKNLKKRLLSYLKPDNVKTEQILKNIDSILIHQTDSEYEALILEANLIKKIRPRYNILLKDDKSFSYIVIDENHSFPRISKYRGKDFKGKVYYGPFPYMRELNNSIELLQKLFLLRSCSDISFKDRKKPCMLYQIKQCSAPCVGKISIDQYNDSVNQLQDFLRGDRKNIYNKLFLEMKKASDNQYYEVAMKYRDRIQSLSKIIKSSNSIFKDAEDTDIICIEDFMDKLLIQISFVRLGSITGHKVIKIDAMEESPLKILEVLISRFYIDNLIPKQILVDYKLNPTETKAFEEFFREIHKRSVKIFKPNIGVKKKMLTYCEGVLKHKILHEFQSLDMHKKCIVELEKLFNVKKITTIEILDNSHCFGSYSVGAIVACGRNGFKKSLYRRYNISNLKSADDYLMLKEVLIRRFLKNDKDEWPEFMIIDGGKGHLKVVLDFFDRHLINNIVVLSIAKGKNRNSGNEIIYAKRNKRIMLDRVSRLKQYIQLLRDEAHRFAISGYREKALASIDYSVLDGIRGIGEERKRKLLTFFGSVKNLQNASLEEIKNVAGISSRMSNIISQYLNKECK